LENDKLAASEKREMPEPIDTKFDMVDYVDGIPQHTRVQLIAPVKLLTNR